MLLQVPTEVNLLSLVIFISVLMAAFLMAISIITSKGKGTKRDRAFEKVLDDLNDIRKATIQEFNKGGQDVTFDHIAALGPEYVEISKGVSVRVEENISSQILVLRCKMADKAELGLHKHSNYVEKFEMTKGALFDKHTNTFFDGYFEFEMNVWHNLVAVGECEMIIRCVKK